MRENGNEVKGVFYVKNNFLRNCRMTNLLFGSMRSSGGENNGIVVASGWKSETLRNSTLGKA